MSRISWAIPSVRACIKNSKTIIESPNSDYAYRMVIPRSILAPFMAGLIDELDYGNFKATIPHSDRLRHDAYYKCWKAMDEWQGKMRKPFKIQQSLWTYPEV